MGTCHVTWRAREEGYSSRLQAPEETRPSLTGQLRSGALCGHQPALFCPGPPPRGTGPTECQADPRQQEPGTQGSTFHVKESPTLQEYQPLAGIFNVALLPELKRCPDQVGAPVILKARILVTKNRKFCVQAAFV